MRREKLEKLINVESKERERERTEIFQGNFSHSRRKRKSNTLTVSTVEVKKKITCTRPKRIVSALKVHFKERCRVERARESVRK